MTFEHTMREQSSLDRPLRAAGVSVVIPMFNEQASVDELLTRLKQIAGTSSHAFEVICVNDGSTDATWTKLIAWRAKWSGLRLIDLSRNFGKEIALMAGIDQAKGGAVVLMDGDLQHPPELIVKFLDLWQQGHDVVIGVRRDRSSDGAVRQTASKLFYHVFNMLSEIPISDRQGDFRLMDRRVVDAVRRMRERSRFMKGIYGWVGFGSVGVEFDAPSRKHGHSSFSVRRLFNLAFDGLLSFSTVPLRIGVLLGGAVAIYAIAMGVYYAIKTLIFGVDVPGFASLIVATLLLGGLILAKLGLVGLYIGRVYEEVKGRPLYIVRRTEADITTADVNRPPLSASASHFSEAAE
ncbi:MAG: glycosyltransferase [Rhodospirillaceae bacterium]|nr:MAG: glycosyltransferase [Rhodospirillaceae bacterium]